MFFYSFEGGAVYKLQKSKLEETIKPEQKKSDFKIIVTGLDRERIKIGTDFTPYFVRFGNFIHYVAHHYKVLFMTLLIDRIDWSLYKILLTLLIIQAQYSNLPLKLTLKWVYHILHHIV